MLGFVKIKVEPFYTRIEGLSPPQELITFNNTFNNVIACILERIIYITQPDGSKTLPPQPKSAAILNLNTLVPVFQATYLQLFGSPLQMTEMEFAVSRPPSKRRRYLTAVQNKRGLPCTKNHSRIGFFTKYEKLLAKINKILIPRPVSPRNINYHIDLGVYIAPIEHNSYAVVDHLFGHPTIMKGYNADEVGKHAHSLWSIYHKTASLDLDVSRFDQHVSVPILLFEHALYNSLYGDNRLAELLNWQLVNNCGTRTTDGYKLNWNVRGHRMSGDMNTALGNCLVMSLIVYLFKEKYGFKLHLLNNGDDCVLFGEVETIEKVKKCVTQFYLDLGFTLKVGEVNQILEKVNFCKTHPIIGPEGTYRMVRQLDALVKDTVMLGKPQNKRSYDLWRASVSLGGLSLTDGLPVYPQFYRAIGRDAGNEVNFQHGGISTGFQFLMRGMLNRNSRVSVETRLSFQRAFDVDLQTQLELERRFEVFDMSTVWAQQGSHHTIQPILFPQLYE